MIIWSGWGIVIGLIGVACLVATNFAVNAAMGDDHYYQANGWPKLLALWLAALVSAPLGWAMNREGARHSLFFIPVQYWWIVYLLLGIVFFFVRLERPAEGP